MKALRPRQIAHRGSVEASALLIDPATIGEHEARARVMALIAPGVTVQACERGYLVRLPRSLRVRAEASPGLPLVRVHDVLSAVPLARDEFEILKPLSDSLVIARAGEVRIVDRLEPIEITKWLDLRAFQTIEVQPLGERPVAMVPLAAPAIVETNAVLGSKLAVDTTAWQSAQGARIEGLGARLVGHVRSLFRAIRGAFSTRSEGGSQAGRSAPARPGVLSRLADELQRWVARFLVASRLSAFLGRRQAEYLAKLFDLFEKGDLDAALRHAIPLGTGVSALRNVPALGVPRPRESLQITTGQAISGGSIALGGDLFGELERRYRSAAQRLVAAGRIEDAAFVYVELLQRPEEAVALLESHGKFRLAAELADARDLAPGLRVRQWWLADERELSVLVARATGAFADAVTRLEKGGRAEARELRLAWADALAASGDEAAAVEVIWKLDDEVARAGKLLWLTRAIERGGVMGARLLPRLLVVLPGAFEKLKPRALELLGAGLEDEAPLRAALAQGLTKALGEADPEARAVLRVLSRTAVRAMLIDGRDLVAAELIRASDDGLLRTDLPRPKAKHVLALASRTEPIALNLEAADHGTRPVHDAVAFSDGRVLVAAGESGAFLLARDGRIVAHFDRPAFQLVPSDHEDRVIAIAKRGRLSLLSRIDLHKRTARPWCEAELTYVARSYDGALLYAMERDRLVALDALHEGLRAIWSVPDLKDVRTLARSPRALELLVGDERWLYELPSHALRQRREVPAAQVAEPEAKVLADVGLTTEGVVEATVDLLTRDLHVTLRSDKPASVVVGSAPLRGFATAGRWVAIAERSDDGLRVQLVDAAGLATKLVVHLHGSSATAPRLDERHLTLTDDRGRVLVVSLATGELVRDLRI